MPRFVFLKCTVCATLFLTEDLFSKHARSQHCVEVVFAEPEKDEQEQNVDLNSVVHEASARDTEKTVNISHIILVGDDSNECHNDENSQDNEFRNLDNFEEIPTRNETDSVVASTAKDQIKLVQRTRNKTKKSKRLKALENQCEKRLFHCDVCAKAFSLKENLKRHMQTHTGEAPYACDLCDKKFKQKAQRITHRFTHFEERSFLCSECGKGFRTAQGLHRHGFTHLKDKNFRCKTCSAKFRYKELLVVHQKTHSSNKPFACSMCDRAFAQRINLQTHLRTHTGEKPYVCCINNCGKAFSRQQSYKAHCSRAHGPHITTWEAQTGYHNKYEYQATVL